MRRCQHFCGCEGNPVGRDPDTGLLLCAGCLGRSILGTDCSLARRYFVHVPARFGEGPWAEPPPLRDGDRTAVPAEFEGFLTVRVGGGAVEWDFLPLAGVAGAALADTSEPAESTSAARTGSDASSAGSAGGTGGASTGLPGIPGVPRPAGVPGVAVGVVAGCVRTGTAAATNPARPPKDPPPGPLPPPPGRPVQPNPPRR
ncbi:hypothetical protein GCM10009839_05040 [Catenulispora yoronensis]|uniref:Uncharacterized protein n=1 Tax=Catenulispora yoronensis TaxID=450799 RepID=A0ABP5F1M4_9ACTN